MLIDSSSTTMTGSLCVKGTSNDGSEETLHSKTVLGVRLFTTILRGFSLFSFS